MSPAASVAAPADVPARPDPAEDLRAALDWARSRYPEDADGALAEAIRCQEHAEAADDDASAARALALQGVLAIHRGDLRGAVRLALGAAARAKDRAEPVLEAELSALRGVLSFFTGSYAEAISQSTAAVNLADRVGTPQLRLYIRRLVCPVLGNIGTSDLRDQLETILALSGDDAREEALSRNDLATMLAQQGDITAAEAELERAFALLADHPGARVARAALHITRAEVRLAAGDPRRCLIDSRHGVSLLSRETHPNPYLLGAAITTEVRGLVALGAVDEAQALGEDTLLDLGERMPQTRSMILTTLAEALHASGRFEEAYGTLARASELERRAFRELAELKLGLDRAALETREAQQRNDSLIASNRQLASAHAELEQRSRELEQLREQLLEQVDRDWLTGLHNRRYLARQLTQLEATAPAAAISVAVLDIDHFKAINDRFGHTIGDQVLVRVARVLQSMLRRADTCVRSGGEEFLLLLPGAEAPIAEHRCERIRARIADQAWEDIAAGLAVSVSIGVGTTADPSDLHALLSRTDQRLYAAKRAGRNQVVGDAPH